MRLAGTDFVLLAAYCVSTHLLIALQLWLCGWVCLCTLQLGLMECGSYEALVDHPVIGAT